MAGLCDPSAEALAQSPCSIWRIMRDSTGAGLTVLTRMLSGASSAAAALARPVSARLLITWGLVPGTAMTPATDDVITTLPPPRARSAAACLIASHALRAFTASTRSNSVLHRAGLDRQTGRSGDAHVGEDAVSIAEAALRRRHEPGGRGNEAACSRTADIARRAGDDAHLVLKPVHDRPSPFMFAGAAEHDFPEAPLPPEIFPASTTRTGVRA